MSRQLPAQPNLEHLKKQAKELLAERQLQNSGWKLSDAQHALAREYGFDSWPKLKAYVQALAPAVSPFVGRWEADVSKSTRHPANLFRRATLEFSVAGDTVSLVHEAVDELGREDRGVNTIQADGIERVHDFGHRLSVRWAGPRVLDVMTTHAGLDARFAKYEVSEDDRTLVVSTINQRLVFDRV